MVITFGKIINCGGIHLMWSAMNTGRHTFSKIIIRVYKVCCVGNDGRACESVGSALYISPARHRSAVPINAH